MFIYYNHLHLFFKFCKSATNKIKLLPSFPGNPKLSNTLLYIVLAPIGGNSSGSLLVLITSEDELEL